MNKRAPIFKLLLSLVAFSSTLYAGYAHIEDRMTESIKTPSLQKVEKAKIRLDNGMEALIISDPQTPKSGAALSVGVGQAHEPFDRVGLAHFVEHMLFMGTEQYPVEKEYHEFIQQNGGKSNAYTSATQTVYMYEINNDKMSEALDRFSCFFYKPLFNESGLSRERLAVDNEFTYRTNNDHIREYLVLLEMAHQDHHLSTWRCGDKKTLEDIPRDELVEWYQQNYGAEKMKLVLYTAQPLDQALAEVDQNFSRIPLSQVSTTNPKPGLLDPQYFGSKVFIEPIKDQKSLSIIWEVPEEFSRDLDHHTLDLVGAALSEEYSKSLAAFLKEKGLIQSLGAGNFSLGEEVTFFQVSMELTERGVQNVDQIVTHCFEAISTLKRNGLPRYRYDEMVNISKTNYHYQSRPSVMSFVSGAANNMQYESTDTFPLKHSWPTQFSPDRNQAFLECLKAENALYLVMAPSELMNKDLNRSETLTQTRYAYEPISNRQLRAWNKVGYNKSIGMAAPNPYIPKNLNLVQTEVVGDPAPELISQGEKFQVYYKQDSVYQVPEVFYSLYINTPSLNTSASSQVLSDIYTLALGDALSALGDQGSTAGLHFGVSTDPNLGLRLVVQGYSENSQLFLEEILSKTKSHIASKNEFMRYSQKLKSYYENQSSKQQPYAQAMEMSRSILFKDHVLYPEKIEVLKKMSYQDFKDFSSSLYDQVYLRVQLYGNLEPAQAHKVCGFLEESFAQSNAYPLEDQPRRAILEFDAKSKPRFARETSQMEGNAAHLLIGQGPMNFEKLAALKVLTKSIQSPFFDTLRTKQQTGYIVQFYSQEVEKQLFSFYMVFSNTHAPRDLLARFELFNEEFIKTLKSEEYGEEKFQAIKGAILEELKQPKRNLSEKGAELSALAFNYDGDFEFNQKLIDATQELSFEEFLEFVETYYGRQNYGRVASFVEGKIDPSKALEYTPILNVNNFKAQLLYTSAKPLKQVESGVNEL